MSRGLFSGFESTGPKFVKACVEKLITCPETVFFIFFVFFFFSSFFLLFFFFFSSFFLHFFFFFSPFFSFFLLSFFFFFFFFFFFQFNFFDKFATHLGPPGWNPEKQSSGQKFGVRGIFEGFARLLVSPYGPESQTELCEFSRGRSPEFGKKRLLRVPSWPPRSQFF